MVNGKWKVLMRRQNSVYVYKITYGRGTMTKTSHCKES
jgi:hypothetical protein